ncbi:type II toxin-antitoxin system death-on-curing family toxin [Anaerococcus sp. NML200537]|uniref:Type II toxin-antitoxin system death-on-curing family toxin n=1 Tax=Anaerococcus kampingae TaxID=3115614 RepID=A0ABW9MBC4_9FIRM|nr:type II toxin-antitoxin system death-on-curing family toxin [Anaerococcus sp. NML200537]MCW6702168.1 type II toxin-antitoxin system death-on-curing family toxin [Anaerococcus sp. NML200537]
MKKFTKEQVIQLHKSLIENFGGIEGVRDDDLLDLSINSAFQTMFGNNIYDTPVERACQLAYSFIMNHPFIDGNKRIGTYLMLIYLKLNGYKIIANDDEIINIIMEVASSNCNKNVFKDWICKNTERISYD